MDALVELQQRGFSARNYDGRLAISPANNLTDSDRDFVRQNREALLAALRDAVTAPVSVPLYRVWDVKLSSGQIVRMVSPEACTGAEALAAAQFRWPDCRVKPYRLGKDAHDIKAAHGGA